MSSRMQYYDTGTIYFFSAFNQQRSKNMNSCVLRQFLYLTFADETSCMEYSCFIKLNDREK